MRSDVLGVVLAGGQSLRYGSDKAFAMLGGVSLVRRAARALEPATARVVLVANQIEKHEAAGLPVRPDLVRGVGPLGGVHTAVAWAQEEGLSGAIVLACDMPFVPSSLVGHLADCLDRRGVVVPASSGPRGFEPLCAVYGVDGLPAIEAAIRRGDRAVVSFFSDVDVTVADLRTVSRFGDPDMMFFNVNRPEDHLRAETLLSGEATAEEPDGAANPEGT